MTDLPELSAAAAPQFVDPAACKAWLEHLPLADVATTQRELAAELELFNRFPTSAANRVAVMEALRETVNFVQVEQAKRFANRALPMLEAEAAVFEATNALWEQMRLGYLRSLEPAAGGDPAMRTQAALLCQRLLAYSGLKMFSQHRACRQVPARDWRSLHEVYAQAERLGVSEEPVKDFLSRDVQDSSPRIVYARAVLFGMANPHELAQRQLTFVAYLLERWAAKLEVSSQAVSEGEGVPPLVADLGSERCPERIEAAEAVKLAEARYLDARKLAKSLKSRVALLRKGESPAKLGLGEDCVQPACEQLLVFLYRQWCQPKPARAGERSRASDRAQACNDLSAIHQCISGRATGIEEWKVEDESAQGLRIVRPAVGAGKRHAHGELIALRLADAPGHLLGQVRWLMVAENGELHAGVKLLPGLPAATAVRPTGVNAQNEKYIPALSLGAVPALNSPASLVLPPGWFKPKRVIEVFDQSASPVRLTGLIERGSDFERVAFEAMA
jgi:cyclic-di-GMP-binding protein